MRPPRNWFSALSGSFATCPITQGSLMRLLIREGQPAAAARAVLDGTTADPRHEFWPDDISYTVVDGASVFPHPLCPNTWLNGRKVGDEPKASGY